MTTTRSAARWVRGGAVVGVAVVALGACSSPRGSQDAAREFVRAVNDDTLAEHTDLFQPALSSQQLSALQSVGQRCDLDEQSLEVLPGGTTPQVERFVVAADCDGERRLLGASTYIEHGDAMGREDTDATIGPEFLPGGSHEGKFPRDQLPEPVKHLPAL